MVTTFSEIYARFSNKITDYVLLELSDQDAVDIMHEYLMSAIPKIRELRVGAFSYVDELGEFDAIINDDDDDDDEGPEHTGINGGHFLHELTDLEKELLSLGMVQEWLEPQIQSVLNTRQFVSSKETQFFAQHNHFNGLMHMQEKIRKEKHYLLTQYKMMHNDYLGTKEATG